MITHSIAGVISSKIGRYLTILLNSGNKIKIKIKRTSLELGDKCHVTFNHETGKISELLGYEETPTDINSIEIKPLKEHLDLEDNPYLD